MIEDMGTSKGQTNQPASVGMSYIHLLTPTGLMCEWNGDSYGNSGKEELGGGGWG